MKALYVILFLVFAVSIFSFVGKRNNEYGDFYLTEIRDFKLQQSVLKQTISASSLSSKKDILEVREAIEKTRTKLKNVDFWLRYLNPMHIGK